MTYCVVSDIHAHAWTVFSKTDPDGVNSRLRITLNELERAADELLAAGGNIMIWGGDALHTRGQIDPEVLNPLRATVETILNKGVNIYAIPGNHDLKSADTNQLASSIQNLQQISVAGGVFQIFNEPVLRDEGFAFVPWRNTHEQLLADLREIADAAGPGVGQVDVFIHAGIDGVLSNMPAHGLNHVKLGSFGFRRVFAGHYHNHKDFGNGVYSIGATTHQNWGDVGTRAGFLLVDDQSVQFRASNAPSFIDVSAIQPEDLPLVLPGNYARFRGATMSNDDVAMMRKEFLAMGALGVSIEVPRTSSVTRSTTPVKARTTEESIDAFVKAVPPVDPAVKAEDVVKRSIEILHESQAVAA